MTAIRYTTKRNLVKTNFLVAGTDISATSVDDSFNSTVTDLSGMLDNEWIEVIGFADDALNGWFEVAGDSTSTKIIIDSATLTIEAAGNTITIQGYKRGLGEDYFLESAFHKIDLADDPIIKSNIALDGTPETLYGRLDIKYDLLTDFVEDAEQPQWLEFFRSVHAKEIFFIDFYGTIAVPVDLIAVRLDGKPSYDSAYGKVKQFRFKVILQ